MTKYHDLTNTLGPAQYVTAQNLGSTYNGVRLTHVKSPQRSDTQQNDVCHVMHFLSICVLFGEKGCRLWVTSFHPENCVISLRCNCFSDCVVCTAELLLNWVFVLVLLRGQN